MYIKVQILHHCEVGTTFSFNASAPIINSINRQPHLLLFWCLFNNGLGHMLCKCWDIHKTKIQNKLFIHSLVGWKKIGVNFRNKYLTKLQQTPSLMVLFWFNFAWTIKYATFHSIDFFGVALGYFGVFLFRFLSDDDYSIIFFSFLKY